MKNKKSSSSALDLSSVSSDSKVLHVVTRLAVILIAIGAAILSFDALTDLAIAAGISSMFAWIWAVVIDGFILVATLAAFAFKDREEKGSKSYAWTTLIVFVILSIVGNAWHAAIVTDGYVLPLGAAIFVTAVPPLALFLAIHLLILMLSPTKEQKEEQLRQKRKKERLKAFEERELEKLEKQAIARELKQAQEDQKQLERKVQLNQAEDAVKIEEYSAPKLITYSSQTSQPILSEDMPVNSSELPSLSMTEEEVERRLNEILESGEALPTGKTVAEWLGKSERTGQNLVKKFKVSKDLV